MKRLKTLIILGILMAGSAAAQPLIDPGIAPGNPFYGLDRASEGLELAFASAVGGPELKSKVLANHAEERLAEAGKLAENNQSDKAGKLFDEYSQTLNKSVKNARKSGNEELADRLENVTRNHVDFLQNVERNVPENARPGIQNAMENAGKAGKALEKTRQERKKPDTPGSRKPGTRPEEPAENSKDVSGQGKDQNNDSRPKSDTPGNPENEPEQPATGNAGSKPVVGRP